MIYEMRTYDLKPRSLPEVVKRFGEKYEERKKFSPLTAFWQTEIGPLNQIIHVWEYKDLAERAEARDASVKAGAWPPKISEFITRMQSDIVVPFPFSPELKPGDFGPYFEMRTYTYNAPDLPKIMADWEAALPARTKLTPVLAMWRAELGSLNKFIHIWPYKSLDERMETRKKAVESGVWPPASKDPATGKHTYSMVTQETKILTASAFSPIR